MNIGIVGCGNIAISHVRLLKRNVNNPKLAFCDQEKKKADNLANRFYQGPTYQTIDELLSREKLDTVHILTPVQSHAILAEKALRAGVHVYVEKPVTEKISEFTELLTLAKSQSKYLCPGYSTLGIPVVQKAKDIISSGNYGRLITIHCNFNWSAHGNAIPYDQMDHWAYSLRGGILQNLVDHPTSLVVDALDEITDYKVVFGKRNSLPDNKPDLLHVTLYSDFQIGSYTVSFGHGNTLGQVVYSLEAATIIVDLRRQLLLIIKGKGPKNFYQNTLSGLKLSLNIGSGTFSNIARRLTGSLQREPGILGLVRNFYNAIDGNEELIVNERTAAQVITLLDQIWEDLEKE